MPYATATRPGAGQYLPLFCHAAEQWATDPQDLISKETVFMDWLDQEGMLREDPTGYALLYPIITENDVPVLPFVEGQADPIHFAEGLGAVRFEPATYRAPVGVTWGESLKIREENEIINLAKHRTYLAAKATIQTLETDIIAGQSLDNSRVLGLEQWLLPVAASTGSGGTQFDTITEFLTAPKWVARQATNTIGGITRTAWTGPDTGGTGFENFSALVSTYSDAASGSRRFATSGGVLNNICQLFQHLYMLSCWGATHPTHIFSDLLPYEDAKAAGQPFIQFLREGAKESGVNWGFSELRIFGADWIYADIFKASGLNGSVAAGESMIYGVHAPTTQMVVDDRYNYSWQYEEWRTIGEPSATYNELVYRPQFLCYQPRFGFSLGKYGT